MTEKTMPVVFSGHGSPMIALEHNEITEGMTAVGRKVLEQYGKPKAILAISAHWYVRGTYIQSAPEPKQVYDMYGFPKELYEVKYPVKGNPDLTADVKALLGDAVSVRDDWGIDHGTWTVLCHMFPKADIPVVQLSVNRGLSAQASYNLGARLAPLRDKGYLIFGSGNIVHNLRETNWDMVHEGTPMTAAFDKYIVDAIAKRDDEAVIQYEKGPHADYAVPTPDHFLPIPYILGATQGEKATFFNQIFDLGSMDMTGFTFGLE